MFGRSAITRVSVSLVELDKGLRGDAKLMVTANDTASALGSGTVDVLGSPRLIALCEEACQNAMASELEPGTTTVGMRVQFDHLQPTPVGAEVFAEAVLKKIDGRRITFEVSATDAGGLIGAGKITRVVVGIDDFMGKCCAPSD
jgi:fluoroacetyl-CoA thioesterase